MPYFKIHGVLAIGLSLGMLGCGETVNFETEEKLASAANLDSGGSDDAEGSGKEDGEDSLGDGDGSEGSIPDGGPGDGLNLCRNSDILVQRSQLVFPEIPAGTTCEFGSGENLSRVDGKIRAYLRQTQIVTLPAGAKLCGLAIDHQDAPMRYDDEMFFSVNDRLLLATKDYSEFLPSQGMFQSFSWDGLVNQVYDSFDQRPVYCVGASEGLSSCTVPATETEGRIEMEFSPEMNIRLSKELEADKALTFEWITTGDNDNSDCRHTNIVMDLDIQYTMP